MVEYNDVDGAAPVPVTRMLRPRAGRGFRLRRPFLPWRAIHVVALLAAAILGGCELFTGGEPAEDDSAEEVRAPEQGPVLPAGIHALTGTDPGLPHDDLTPFGQLVGPARVVAIGESSHEAGGMLQVRHRMIRYLVEELGFRAVAFETEWQDAQLVDRYVQTCEGDPADVVLDGMRPVWHAQETADLLRWLCEFNAEHPDDPVAFFGFNNMQPHHDGPELMEFIRAHMPRRAETLPAALARCEGVTYASEHEYREAHPGPVRMIDYRACTTALDSIEAHLSNHRDELASTLGDEQLRWLWLRLTGLRGWEEYRTFEPLPRGITARDRAMARIFIDVWQMRQPEAKVVLAAHSLHVNTASDAVDTVFPPPGAERDFWEGTVRMGDWLATDLGDDYLPVSIVSNHHNWGGSRVDPPADQLEGLPGDPQTVEALLHRLGQPVLLVDLHRRGRITLWRAPPGVEDGDTGEEPPHALLQFHPDELLLDPAREYHIIYPIPIGDELLTGVLRVPPAHQFRALIYIDEVAPRIPL